MVVDAFTVVEHDDGVAVSSLVSKCIGYLATETVFDVAIKINRNDL